MNFDMFTADLERDEGFEPLLYDDATGKRLAKGSTIEGNPTVGFGWNVAGMPLSRQRAQIILGWFAADIWAEVCGFAPWATGLPDPVQRALGNMAFNMGLPTLQKFTTFLGLLEAGKFQEAASDLKTTPWYRETGDRAVRIVELISL